MKSDSKSLQREQIFETLSKIIKNVLENKKIFLILYYTNLLEKKISCKEKRKKQLNEFFRKEIIKKKEYNLVEEDEEEIYLTKNCHFEASISHQKSLSFQQQQDEIIVELSTGIQSYAKVRKNGVRKKSTKAEREEKKLQGILKRVSTLEDEESEDEEEDDEDEEDYEDEEDEEIEHDEEEEEEESEFSHGDEKEQEPEEQPVKRRRGRPKKIKEEKPTRKIIRKKNTPTTNTKDLESKLKTYFYIQENCVEWKEERIGAKKKILGNFLGKTKMKMESSSTPTTPTTPSILQKLTATAPVKEQAPMSHTMVKEQPPPPPPPPPQQGHQQQQYIPQQTQNTSAPTSYKIPKKKSTPTTPVDKLSSPTSSSSSITKSVSTPIPPDISTRYPKEVLIQWCKHHMYPLPLFKEIKRSHEGIVVGVILPHLNNLLFSDPIFSSNLEISENRACMKAIEYMWSMTSQQQQPPPSQDFVNNSLNDRRYDNSEQQWRQQNRMRQGYDQQQKYYNQQQQNNRYYDDKNYRY
eukprot:gene6213-10219_t